LLKPGGLTDNVRRFIEQRIETAEQLDILLLLVRDASHFWSAEAVARALHLSARPIADLETLARQGLLDVRITSDVVYRFSPATAAIADDMEDVAAAYLERRSELRQLIASARHRSLKYSFMPSD
jgi:hypothetical protein